MFEFTSTLPSMIDYGQITKVQSEIRNLQDLTPTLNRLCGANPVPEDMDDVMVMRSYQNRTGVPLVMRGSKAIKIGGGKEKFDKYEVDPFIMLDSYTKTQLEKYKAMFRNRAEIDSVNAIRNKFIALAMQKGYISLNGMAIKGTVGGDVSMPMLDGNGQATTSVLNFGKVHGTSATDSTLASFTVANVSSSSKISDFLKNVSKMTTALIQNGVNLNGASFMLGETLFWTVAGLVEGAVSTNDAINRKIVIGDMGDDYFTLNGRKFELATDSYTDPNTTAVTKLCEDKEMKIIGAPSYHLWTYLKPDEEGVNSPVLYFAKDWYENNPSARTMLFNMRHIVIPDTNAIAKATMMA